MQNTGQNKKMYCCTNNVKMENDELKIITKSCTCCY